MTTQADIKLVIDRLQGMERQALSSDEIAIFNATEMLETLGNQVVAQAALIEKLRDSLEYYANSDSDQFGNTARKALSITPDQALEQFAEKVREQCIAELWKGNKHGFHRSLEEAEDAIREMAKEEQNATD